MIGQKVLRLGQGSLLLLIAVFLVATASAGEQGDPTNIALLKTGDDATANVAPVTSVTQSPASKMSSVERVYIRVLGLASLTGEYRINGDGTVALPGLGRLAVGDATIAEFEAQLATEIQRISNRESNVAVEVIDYRPVFVSGVVARSGAFAWKPGFSVLHAETLAGGIFRGVGATESPMLQPATDREHERVVRSGYELAATLASVSRLKAEMNNEATYVLPPRVTQLISKADQQSLFAAQQATLASRLSVFNAKMTAAHNAKAIAIKERQVLEEQVVRIQSQLAQRRVIVARVEHMVKNRQARGELLFDEQMKVAALEERLTTTTLGISRAEMAAGAATQELETLTLGRKADIDSELMALEQKKVQLEIDIESANNVYRRATGQDAMTSRFGEPLVPRYEIVRVEEGSPRVVRAERGTPILPGDVVVVSFGRPDAT